MSDTFDLLEVPEAPTVEGGPPADALCELLTGYSYQLGSERVLQDGVERVLTQHGIAHQREFSLSPSDRPDFFLPDGLAIEIKIDGSLAQALRQVNRYLAHDRVRAVLLLGTPHWLSRVPADLSGKPLYRLRLMGSLL